VCHPAAGGALFVAVVRAGPNSMRGEWRSGSQFRVACSWWSSLSARSPQIKYGRAKFAGVCLCSTCGSLYVCGGWVVGGCGCGGVVSAGCRHHVVGIARPCADGMTTRSTRGCGSWQQGHPLTAKSRPDPVHARGAHPECEFLGRLQSARTHSATWVARSGLWRTAGPHVACDAAIM